MGFERDRRDANLGVGVVIICVQAVSSRGYQRLEFFQDEHRLVSVELGILRGFHRFSPTLLFSLFCSFVVLLTLLTQSTHTESV